MLICQHNAEFGQATGDEEDCDWSLAARAYPELREMPSYISQQHQEFVAQSALTTTAHASHLQGKQLQAYTAVREHSESSDPNQPPLRIVVSGTAGTGKSYLIQCLKLMLKDRLCVAAPTVYQSRETSSLLKESTCRPFSRCWQQSTTSSLMRCRWLAGRCFDRWTDDCIKCSPRDPKSSLVYGPVC